MITLARLSGGTDRKHLILRLATGVTILLVLLAVTSSYLEPGFVVTLANQVWTCF